jgi:C-terminal processing protease CtpA/Prc
MYVNILTLFSRSGNPSIKKVMEEMVKQLDQKQAEKLIIDLRHAVGEITTIFFL